MGREQCRVGRMASCAKLGGCCAGAGESKMPDQVNHPDTTPQELKIRKVIFIQSENRQEMLIKLDEEMQAIAKNIDALRAVISKD